MQEAATVKEPMMPKKPSKTKQPVKEPTTVMEWLAAEGAVEGVKYDEDTGRPYRVFTIDLTRQ